MSADHDHDLLSGFADAEALILAMAEAAAAEEYAKRQENKLRSLAATTNTTCALWDGIAARHFIRAQVLGEFALAIRLGQHRTDAYDPDTLAAAHRKAANTSSQGRRGGEVAASNMTSEERVARAKKASAARWKGNRP